MWAFAREGCSSESWAASIAALCLGVGGHSGGGDDCDGDNGSGGDARGCIAGVGQCNGDV